MKDSTHIRVENGNYFADVLQVANATGEFWYYLILRKDSADILDLARFESKEETIEAAQKALSRLHNAAAAN